MFRHHNKLFQFLNSGSFIFKHFLKLGGSSGLVAMEEDSCSEDCGFKSQHHILDGNFFTYICCKNVMFVWKEETNEKEAVDGPFKNTFLKFDATLWYRSRCSTSSTPPSISRSKFNWNSAEKQFRKHLWKEKKVPRTLVLLKWAVPSLFSLFSSFLCNWQYLNRY